MHAGEGSKGQLIYPKWAYQTRNQSANASLMTCSRCIISCTHNYAQAVPDKYTSPKGGQKGLAKTGPAATRSNTDPAQDKKLGTPRIHGCKNRPSLCWTTTNSLRASPTPPPLCIDAHAELPGCPSNVALRPEHVVGERELSSEAMLKSRCTKGGATS